MIAIEHVGRQTLKVSLAVPRRAAGINDVIALLPASDEVGDQFGRVLQIGVDDHHRAPSGVINPGGQRDFLAEIARQRDQADTRILSMVGANHLGRCVFAAVVGENDLPGETRGVQRRASPRQELGQHDFLVISGHDKADVGTVDHRSHMPYCIAARQ